MDKGEQEGTEEEVEWEVTVPVAHRDTVPVLARVVMEDQVGVGVTEVMVLRVVPGEGEVTGGMLGSVASVWYKHKTLVCSC